MNRILFFTAFPPNKLTAGQNYSRELLSSLSEDYSIDLIFFSYPNHEIEVNSKVNVLKKVNVSTVSKFYSWTHFPFLHPFFLLRFRLRLLLFLIKNAKNYKFLYFDFSQVFIYSLFLKKSFKILMCHDVIYQKLKRNRFFYLNPFNSLLFFTEKYILKSADLLLTFSKKDQLLLKNNYDLNSSTINFFINDKIKFIDYNKVNLSFKFCFFGAWNRPENMQGLIWFVDNVLPHLKNEIKFEIIGPGLDVEFTSKIKNNKNIKYLGFLEDPYIKIAECQALIAPIFQGAGVKVKVIESLAAGTPVIGTEVAFEGIDDFYEGSLLLCKEAKDFIHVINALTPISIDVKRDIKNSFEKSYQENKIKDLLISLTE
ncbi:glycosyltransferase [Flavobacterium sp. ZT3R17]|uniref:glycosyltransferase n=1 Tax=Flavobacterium cryoconiti TaxID=3398736 RepID=UPI003A898CFF